MCEIETEISPLVAQEL